MRRADTVSWKKCMLQKLILHTLINALHPQKRNPATSAVLLGHNHTPVTFCGQHHMSETHTSHRVIHDQFTSCFVYFTQF